MRSIQIAAFLALPLFVFSNPIAQTYSPVKDPVPIPASVPASIVAILKTLNYKDDDQIIVHLQDGSVRYIIYAALKRDCIPCDRRNDSWMNCHPGAYANDYQHACNAVTQCRS
ncbi:uncharacterized protein MYCFIDRAFT_201584 [Pseudocercospora fijiensis CIRAD86]|uniref:Uncharacterized protein n=1 Tax=Pseudocercospora fijiensis (strain CIRAD86) TaxID=383855 RepID=N1QBI0_PSEFD|nr:uncharacterized protein MYCFIDRAFT_201584 [Pseudocercospora fijiensis CIRAD86]EME88547.1 hypothetical protein MYCFIDRAFT_201584 [Pseudocercospora fijiensis CIRAD86]